MSSSAPPPQLPPEGWYVDPERADQHRFWNGAAWTEERRPLPTAPPPPPPPPPLGAVGVAVPAPLTSTAPAVDVCPVCRQSDMLRNVGALLDDGTSTTQGRSRTVSTGYGTVSAMGSDGTLYSGSATTSQIGTTTHHTVTRTQLVSRFTPPPRPTGHFGAWFLLGWIVPALLVAVLWGPALAPASADLGPVAMIIVTIVVTFAVMLALTWVFGIIVGVVHRAVTAASLARRRDRWDRGVLRLRSAAYCARDGVAVESGRSYTPEGLRHLIFES